MGANPSYANGKHINVMTAEQKQLIAEKLKCIRPGQTYPTSVIIIERAIGELTDTSLTARTIKFYLNSFQCGMYCAIFVGDQIIPMQTGDNNNKTFVRKIEGDIRKALNRDVESIEIGSILQVKSP